MVESPFMGEENRGRVALLRHTGQLKMQPSFVKSLTFATIPPYKVDVNLSSRESGFDSHTCLLSQTIVSKVMIWIVIVPNLVKMGYKSISGATDQVVPEIHQKSVLRLYASQADFASSKAG
jgi:hypothetical protein